jgi:hypothetical protein
MNTDKQSKQELLKKCEEHGITKCKSKNKTELIKLINEKTNVFKNQIKLLQQLVQIEVPKIQK